MEQIHKVMSMYMCRGKYTHKVHDLISKCKQVDIELFLKIIGCKNTKHLTVNEYVVNINTNKTLVRGLSFIFKSMQNYRLYFYDLESLRNLINSKSEMIIQQLYCTINNKRHLLMLIIDKCRKKIMLFDSNCVTHITHFIEQTITQVVELYNKTYYNNYHVEQVIYNGIIKLNRFVSTNINGLCVILSLVVTHYMLLTKSTLEISVRLFSSLSDDDLLTIVRSYSLFYYVCCDKF